MSVNKPLIKSQVLALLTDMKARTDSPEAALDDLADGLADIVAQAVTRAVNTAVATNVAVPVLSNAAGPCVGTVTVTTSLAVTP